jgi:hypothetical protein
MMNKTVWATFLAFSLIGCRHEEAAAPELSGGEAAPSEEIQYSFNIPPRLITDSGLFVYWESEKNPEELAALGYEVYDRDDIETWWIEVQSCLGLEAEPPIVRIVDDVRDLCPWFDPMVVGAYCSVDGVAQVLVEVDAAYNSLLPVWQAGGDRRVWKHEAIHHILAKNGIVEDPPHTPIDLWRCQNH